LALWHKVVSIGIDDVVSNPDVRRLLREWTRARGAGGLTPAVDAVALPCSDLMPKMMLLHPEGDDFRYRHYGADIVRHSGFDMSGRTVSEFGGEVGAFFLERYREVQRTGTPQYTVHYSDRAKTVFTWERLILPLIGNDGQTWLLAYNQPLESRLQLLESVFNASSDGLLALRAVARADGTVEDWLVLAANARLGTLLGPIAAQPVGRLVSEALPNWRALGLDGHCERAMRSSGSIEVELSLNLAGGRRHLEARAGPMDGGCVLVLVDVSERRAAQERQRELETQLRESQKLEAIGTLAAGIAHDFNNVLGAILGNLAMIQDDVGAAHPTRVKLDQVQQSALRARSLVQQLLTFARRDAQSASAQPLAPFVDETLAMLRATVPAGVTLRRQVSPDPIHARVDGPPLRQALMHLAINAWHALPDTGGVITIGLDAAIREGQACAHLWVADNGSGMDAPTQARIFEPFFTTKSVERGTGLGLAVVHGVVRSHGGSIEVESAPGAGSRLDVWLPRVASAMPADVTQPAASHPAHDDCHVLYIDDDEVMGLTAEQMLQRLGYRTTYCSDPADAIERVRANPAAIDLVVTDYNMPQLNGMDVARAMAAIDARLPVVINSGYVSDDLIAQARAAGVRHVLRKEHTADELGAVVSQVLTTSQVRRRST
jgi:signal transduction histidine kinase/ActR/RegA family two-component response regulator